MSTATANGTLGDGTLGRILRQHAEEQFAEELDALTMRFALMSVAEENRTHWRIEYPLAVPLASRIRHAWCE